MELDFCNHVLGHLKIGVEKVLGINKTVFLKLKNTFDMEFG
jgi:hypothetical protein